MTKNLMKLALVGILALCLGDTARAQEAQKGPLPLRVQIVISRYQGDKKVSSLPYMISVNSDRARASLRMGGQVPIVSTTYIAMNEGKPGTPQSSVSYRDIGTSVDCTASVVDDTRFRLDLSIEDSSIYSEGAQNQNTLRGGDHPAFRSFRSSDTLILKDGQSAQFTSATDKMSGEVVKVDVTLTVVR